MPRDPRCRWHAPPRAPRVPPARRRPPCRSSRCASRQFRPEGEERAVAVGLEDLHRLKPGMLAADQHLLDHARRLAIARGETQPPVRKVALELRAEDLLEGAAVAG